MTVIVWDGKTLVADRRVNGDPSETASRATKILTFEDKPWRDDESLLAVSFAGNAHILSFMLDYIKRHKSSYKTSLKDRYRCLPSACCSLRIREPSFMKIK